MRRILTFAKRNLIEMRRDPLSWIFCVAFPIVMLIIMTVVDSAIPAEANQTLFKIGSLAGAIAVFGQMFVMLFTAIALSKDRTGAFLIRLYASPMKGHEFVAGYILPMILIAFVQAVISFAASLVISLINGGDLDILGLLVTSVAVMPSALMFTAIGLLAGALFNEKAAPGICSIFISIGSILGGLWFDIEGVGGIMEKIARCLPFYYATKLARSAIKLDFGIEGFVVPLIVVTGSAVLLTVISGCVFAHRMRSDLK